MEIRVINSEQYKEWDSFVESSSQGSIYNLSWYLAALNFKGIILGCFSGTKIIGGFVLIKNELGLNGNPILYKYGGILFKSQKSNKYKAESERRRIVECFLGSEFLKKTRGFNYCFSPNFNDFLPFYYSGYKAQPLYTYRVLLNEIDTNNITSTFYNKLKSEYNFASKSNYSVETNLPFSSLWSTIESTFGKQGGNPPFKKENLKVFLETLLKKETSKVIGIRDGSGILLCSGVMIFDNHTGYFILNGISKDIKRGANEMLLAEFIKYSSSINLTYFDFEGSMLKPIESFYRKFNGERLTYLKIYKPSLTNFCFESFKVLYKKIKYGK